MKHQDSFTHFGRRMYAVLLAMVMLVTSVPICTAEAGSAVKEAGAAQSGPDGIVMPAADYTVDFTYNGDTHSYAGYGSYKVQEVLDSFDVPGTVESVSLILTEGQENDAALRLARQGEDWILTSEEAFTSEYRLNAVMKDGSVYNLTVRDTSESSDLTSFLKSAVISGAAQDSAGGFIVEKDQVYSIALTFEESADLQFDHDDPLTYSMPAGISAQDGQSGTIKIDIVYNGRTYQVGAGYTLGTNGNLSIEIDKEDSDYSKLTSSTNVSFRVVFSAAFDGSKEIIKFSDGIELDIFFSEPEAANPEAFVEISAAFDETTGLFRYTVTVTADGNVKNVNVRDVISGDALIFNNDASVSGNSSDYTANSPANGFGYTFASMSDGEEIEIKYTASVDFSKDTNNDGTISAAQTLNTVTVTANNITHTSKCSREIVYKTTVLSNGTENGVTGDGERILSWTITYNQLALASAAGDTIKDTIDSSSGDYMKYYGDGITVKVYKKQGTSDTLVATRVIGYDYLTSHSDSSWTYTIPSEDTDYYYVITYQTVVDMKKVTGLGTAVTLTNAANGVQGTAVVSPPSKISVTAAVESYTTKEITWVSTICVPAAGLTEAVVTDTVPTQSVNGEKLYDCYKNESLEITGLLTGESFTSVVTSDPSKMVITFYKDTKKTDTGLQGTSGGHTITIRLKTTVNQAWLQTEESDDVSRTHTNSVDINGETASASVTYVQPGITNAGEKYSETSNTEIEYSGITYSVILSGVYAVPLNISCTFDTSMLEVDSSKSICIYGGNQHYQGSGETPVSYSETAAGIQLTANSVPLQNGQYYPYYRITYYLKLKNGVYLESLAAANGGAYDIINTVEWGDLDSSHTLTIGTACLDIELLNRNSLGETNRTAEYKITFNEDKATLNSGKTMEIENELSANLSVNSKSIAVVTDPAGSSVPYSLAAGTNGTTVVTYTVPDATSVTITYNASVSGNGTQKTVNRATVENNWTMTVEDEKNYGTGSDGQGTVASFTIVMVDGFDTGKVLEGAQLKIFAEDTNLTFDQSGTKEVTLTTDDQGIITLDGSQYTFYFDKAYHIQEVGTPGGYFKNNNDYSITLTNDVNQVNHGQNIYYCSESMQIKNWPLEGLTVEKQVESSSTEELERSYNFSFSVLNDDGTVNTDFNEQNGEEKYVNGVIAFTLKNGGKKMLWGLNTGTKYKVEETGAEEFATIVCYPEYDESGAVTETKSKVSSLHSGVLSQSSETIVFKSIKGAQTEASVKIVWSDGENQDGKRPASLKATLSSGTEVTLNDANSWTAKVENLPKYKNGTEIAYTWTEGTLPDGYTLTGTAAEGTVTTLTNSHTPEVTEASVKVVWDDAENQDGKRPAELKAKLSSGTEVTLNDANSWTAKAENLPKYKNGTDIAYTWTEGTLPEGYTLTGTATEGTVTTLTNSHTPEVTEASVKVVWSDGENQDGKRPASLKATLSSGTEVTLNDANSWTAKVENLPKYKNGTEIAYTWTEGALPEGYTLTGTAAEGTVTTLTNSYTPEVTEASVKVIWSDGENQDGKRPAELKATLSSGTEVTLNEANSWTAKAENLPKYKNGTEIAYTWTEGALPEGYTLTGTAAEGTVTTLTNSYTPEVTEASVKVIWSDGENQDGKRPAELKATLSSGTEVTLNEANSWTAKVENLPKYKNGTEIAYTWTEGTLPDGYMIESTSREGTVTTITNKYAPGQTSATVRNVWDDAGNQDGKRPESLKVVLMENGAATDRSVTLNAGNSWEATISSLDQYKNGTEVEYTWTEDTVPEGYKLTKTEKDGTVTTLTNSYTPEVTEASVKVVWSDAENQDGKRPAELKARLSSGAEVTLNEANSWTAKAENLPKYKNGTEIAYTWTEGTLPEGYTLTGTAVEGTVTTLTNSYTPEVTEASVKVIWNDAENQDGKRPAELKARLSSSAEVTLNEANSWTAKVEKLPKYKNGTEIAYTWTEGTLPEGYTLTKTEKNGTVTTLTNSYTPEVTEASVKVVWDDAENRDGMRPAELKVTLSSGTEVTLNEANSWTAKAENLPKYGKGEEIAYTWIEDTVPEGYTLTKTEKDGTVTTLTNTHLPDTVSVKVTFRVVNGFWDDGTKDNVVVTLTGYKGDTLKLEAKQIPAVGTKPAEGYVIGGWNIVPKGETVTETDTTYTYTYTAEQYEKSGDGYISRCYQLILNREPDQAGYEFWTDRLGNGNSKATEIVFGFICSDEYAKRGKTAEETVDILFQAMLDRKADEAEKTEWVEKLESGAGYTDIIDSLAGSGEFRETCEEFAIAEEEEKEEEEEQEQGEGKEQEQEQEEEQEEDKVKAFVERCYSLILNRGSDEEGLNNWVTCLKTGKLTAAEIIYGFMYSQEYINRKMSNEDTVEIMYNTMLNRGSDPAGKKDWVSRLAGGNTIANIINGFSGSQEFGALCIEYGITPGSLKTEEATALSKAVKTKKTAPEAKAETTETNAGETAETAETLETAETAETAETLETAETAETKQEETVDVKIEETENLLGEAVQESVMDEDKAKEFVGRCYKAALGREAGDAELKAWVEQIVSGKKSPEKIVKGFLFSEEFTKRNLENTEIVKVLYRIYMNREADPEGLAFWKEKLDGGMSLEDAVKGFAASEEFRAVLMKLKK